MRWQSCISDIWRWQLRTDVYGALLQPKSAGAGDAVTAVLAGLRDVRRGHAAYIGADFATLSPVAATRSHPQTPPLGWDRFQSLAEAAALPVFAIGGMAPAYIAQARQNSGHGVSGARGFWL